MKCTSVDQERSTRFGRRNNQIRSGALIVDVEMKLRTSITFICLLIWIVSFGQQKVITVDWTEYFNQIQRADSFFQVKEYLKSAKTYSEAFAINNQNSISGHRYQAACAWAMIGQKDSAIKNLRQDAEVLNFYNYSKLIDEKAFEILHNSKVWEEIKEKVKMNLEEENKKTGKYADIKNRLEEILELDQKYRISYVEIWKKYGDRSPEMKEVQKKMIDQDSINLRYVSSIIDKYGWISYDTIGFKANQALFLVIQHSDSATQEKYLPVLKEAVKENKAFGQQQALLEDRVLIRRGKKQVYGSQIQCDSTGKNCWVLPIEDEGNVDKRRAEMGLPQLAEYLKTWNIVYKKPE